MTRLPSHRALSRAIRCLGILVLVIGLLGVAPGCASSSNSCNPPNCCNPCEDPCSPYHPIPPCKRRGCQGECYR